MNAANTKVNWLQKHLEEPFLQAELARAEMLKVESGRETMTPVIMLTVYAVGFAVFCSYWAAKLWF